MPAVNKINILGARSVVPYYIVIHSFSTLNGRWWPREAQSRDIAIPGVNPTMLITSRDHRSRRTTSAEINGTVEAIDLGRVEIRSMTDGKSSISCT